MEKGFKIADLIVAFIKGEISREELEMLDEWIEEAEENKALFVSFMDEVVFEEEKKWYDNERLDAIFTDIKARKRKLQRQQHIPWYAAAAACVAIVFSVFIFSHRDTEPVVTEAPSISIGKQMAYLFLSSGEKIVLEAHLRDTITTGATHRQIILNDGKVEIENTPSDTVVKEEYHTMEVPRGAEYNLTLSDGTKVWLNADTRLKFPAHFNSDKRYVELTGEAYFQVSRDETRPFIVHSGDIDVRVLGTEFCIRNYTDKPTLATLVNGSVEVTDYSGRQMVLTPGQQTVTANGYTSVRDVETIYYTSWKDGYFIFENTPLEEIMEELSLWYDCQYFFQNTAAAELRITARLKKYDEIDVLLGILSKTNEIQIEKKGNAILIRQK